MVVFVLLCSVVREATWITGGHSITKVRLMDLESEVHTTNNHSWSPHVYLLKVYSGTSLVVKNFPFMYGNMKLGLVAIP